MQQIMSAPARPGPYLAWLRGFAATARTRPWSAALGRASTVVYFVGLLAFCFLRPQGAVDADAYWAVNLAHPYTSAVATDGAFLYPPPAAFVFALLGHIPWT